MQRFMTLATVAMLAVTSIVLVTALVTARPGPPSEQAPAGAARTIIRSYYDAVNHHIATGDAEPLRSLIEPRAFDNLLFPWSEQGLTGFERYLDSLHLTDPEIRILPGSLFSSGDWIATEPAVISGPASGRHVFYPVDNTVLWPEIERFLIEREQIIEIVFDWNGLILAESLQVNQANAIAPYRQIEAAQIDLSSGSAVSPVAAETSTLVIPLSSGVDFRLADSTRAPTPIYSGNGPGNADLPAVLPGSMTTLMPGDLLVVPPGAAFSLSTDRDTPTFVFVVSTKVPLSTIDTVSPTAPLPYDGLAVRATTWESSHQEAQSLAVSAIWITPSAHAQVSTQSEMLAVCTVEAITGCHVWPSGTTHPDIAGPFTEAIGEHVLRWRPDHGSDMLINPGDQTVFLWVLSLS